MKNQLFNYAVKMAIFIVCFNTLQLTAQTNYLSGQLQGEEFIDGSKISLLIFEESLAKIGWSAGLSPDTIVDAPINREGKFELTFTPVSKLFYFKILAYRGDRKIVELNRDFLVTPYLGEKGDSIHVEINISRDRVQFSGLGADKLNCQYLLNRLKVSSESRGPYYFMGPFNKVQPFTSFEKIHLSNLAYRLAIIDQYDGIIDQSVLNLIKNNVLASTKYEFARFMAISAFSLSNDVSDALSQYFVGNDKISTLLTEDSTLVDAPNYSDFILWKSELKYLVENKISRNVLINREEKDHYFNWMYNFLKKTYFHSLRDRLIICWFKKTSTEYRELQSRVMDDATSIIKEKRYVEVFNMYARSTLVTKVYNFEFIDENNNIHSPKDYLDKILIMDFWFTGCLWCIKIPPVLQIIREEFKNRDDVVFLSINVESSKEGWLNGLKSGLYTMPGQIHLKIPGNGRLSPFIMNYQIKGYPHLMVVGKNGKMLSVSPRDPRKDNGQDIINIVKQAIQ